MLNTNILIIHASCFFLGTFEEALGAWCNINLIAITIMTIDLWRFLKLTLDALCNHFWINRKSGNRPVGQTIYLA